MLVQKCNKDIDRVKGLILFVSVFLFIDISADGLYITPRVYHPPSSQCSVLSYFKHMDTVVLLVHPRYLIYCTQDVSGKTFINDC
jgi:hypothetical protein